MPVVVFKPTMEMKEKVFGYEPGQGPPEDSREALERSCKVLLERIRMEGEPVEVVDLLYSLAAVAICCESHSNHLTEAMAKSGIRLTVVRKDDCKSW